MSVSVSPELEGMKSGAGQMFAFRADASVEIGSGHVMRCLTLAEALREQGHSSIFVSRHLPGDLIAFVESRGFEVCPLGSLGDHSEPLPMAPKFHYEEWLLGGWKVDAAETLQVLQGRDLDWFVVDHYGIDERWQSAVRCGFPAARVLVIDDLADRRHVADVLLDQNLGRHPVDYRELVPTHCEVLTGVRYSLLRTEFRQERKRSLLRRETVEVPRRLLVNLGGVDKDNVTSQVIESLEEAHSVPDGLHVDVVVGPTGPHLREVHWAASASRLDMVVHAGTTQMAKLMAESDLAIGAAGATSWERCCLGLPSIVVILAENQRHLATQLQEHGVAQMIDRSDLPATLWEAWAAATEPAQNVKMGDRAALLVDGLGAGRVVHALTQREKPSD